MLVALLIVELSHADCSCELECLGLDSHHLESEVVAVVLEYSTEDNLSDFTFCLKLRHVVRVQVNLLGVLVL